MVKGNGHSHVKKWQCMKWPLAHSPNSTWFWLELVGNCCEWLKIIMKYTNIQFCERLGHGWQFHALKWSFCLVVAGPIAAEWSNRTVWPPSAPRVGPSAACSGAEWGNQCRQDSAAPTDDCNMLDTRTPSDPSVVDRYGLTGIQWTQHLGMRVFRIFPDFSGHKKILKAIKIMQSFHILNKNIVKNVPWSEVSGFLWACSPGWIFTRHLVSTICMRKYLWYRDTVTPYLGHFLQLSKDMPRKRPKNRNHYKNNHSIFTSECKQLLPKIYSSCILREPMEF